MNNEEIEVIKWAALITVGFVILAGVFGSVSGSMSSSSGPERVIRPDIGKIKAEEEKGNIARGNGSVAVAVCSDSKLNAWKSNNSIYSRPGRPDQGKPEQLTRADSNISAAETLPQVRNSIIKLSNGSYVTFEGNANRSSIRLYYSEDLVSWRSTNYFYCQVLEHAHIVSMFNNNTVLVAGNGEAGNNSWLFVYPDGSYSHHKTDYPDSEGGSNAAIEKDFYSDSDDWVYYTSNNGLTVQSMRLEVPGNNTEPYNNNLYVRSYIEYETNYRTERMALDGKNDTLYSISYNTSTNQENYKFVIAKLINGSYADTYDISTQINESYHKKSHWDTLAIDRGYNGSISYCFAWETNFTRCYMQNYSSKNTKSYFTDTVAAMDNAAVMSSRDEIHFLALDGDSGNFFMYNYSDNQSGNSCNWVYNLENNSATVCYLHGITEYVDEGAHPLQGYLFTAETQNFRYVIYSDDVVIGEDTRSAGSTTTTEVPADDSSGGNSLMVCGIVVLIATVAIVTPKGPRGRRRRRWR